MKKVRKYILTALVACLAAVLGLFVASCDKKSGEYSLKLVASNVIVQTEEGLFVEHGTFVTIPQAYVADKDGDMMDGYTVTRTVKNKDGQKVAASMLMNHGDEYTVTYTAEGDTKVDSLTLRIYCLDTILPTIDILNFNKAYQGGETATFKVNNPSSDIDYENSTLVLKNLTANTQSDLSFEANNEVLVAEGSEYEIVATLYDVNGNENIIVFPFIGTGTFVDTDIDEHAIWDFDEMGYMNNIVLTANSDDLDYEITSDMPSATSSGIQLGESALKMVLEAGKTYEVLLQKGNGQIVENMGTVSFRIYTEEVIDIFHVVNVEDGLKHNFSWKVYQRDAWQVVSFDPSGAFLFDYFFDTCILRLSCEETTTVYIDEIYWNEVESGWQDEDVAENVLAAFDEEAYMQRVSAASVNDHTTYDCAWSYVDEIENTEDFDGAIKFISMTDLTTTSDKRARDGFTYTLFDRMSAEDFKDGLSFRIYMEDEFNTLTISFIDRRLGETGNLWVSVPNVQHAWVDINVSIETMLTQIKGFRNITALSLRLLRTTQNPEGNVWYMDSISLLDYSTMNYDFSSANDNDLLSVASKNGGISRGIVADSSATDGYALKGVSGLNFGSGSGLTLSFTNKELSKYERIVIRYRVEQGSAVSLNANDVYLHYMSNSSYVEIDILDLMKKNATLQSATHLNSIAVYRTSLANQTFYIDSVKFYEKTDFTRVNYDFSSADDYDFETSRSTGDATMLGIVADNGAKDGYAIAVAIAYNGGLEIKFDALDVSKYSQIIVRVKTGTHVNLYLNDIYCAYVSYTAYTEVDLIPYLTQKGITTLDSVSFTRNVTQKIWIDCIEFVLASK